MKRKAQALLGCLMIGASAIIMWEKVVKELWKRTHPFEPGPLYVGKRGNHIVLYAQISKKEKVVYTFTWNQARKLVYDLERIMNEIVNNICYDCIAKYDKIMIDTNDTSKGDKS